MDNHNMDTPIEETTLATISLLEARLLRIEHLLYGHTASAPSPAKRNAVQSVGHLERRFGALLKDIRVYADILKICRYSRATRQTHAS